MDEQDVRLVAHAVDFDRNGFVVLHLFVELLGIDLVPALAGSAELEVAAPDPGVGVEDKVPALAVERLDGHCGVAAAVHGNALPDDSAGNRPLPAQERENDQGQEKDEADERDVLAQFDHELLLSKMVGGPGLDLFVHRPGRSYFRELFIPGEV